MQVVEIAATQRLLAVDRPARKLFALRRYLARLQAWAGGEPGSP